MKTWSRATFLRSMQTARFRLCSATSSNVNPTNPDLLNNHELLQYLCNIRCSQQTRMIYAKLLQLLNEQYRTTGMTTDDIQCLCNILGDFPEPFSKLAEFLPPHRRFRLSEDFEHTRLVLVVQDETVVERRASFGLIDADSDRKRYRFADDMISHLLSSAFQEHEREEALITLRGGDAQRAILHIQQLVADRGHWTRLSEMAPKGESFSFQGKEWQRARAILIRLAAASNRVPTSLQLIGLQVDVTYCEPGECGDIYIGRYKGRKIALKRLRVFSTSICLGKATALREALLDGALSWQTLRHPRLLPFLGIDNSTIPGVYCPVSPWAPHGNVRQCIKTLEARGDPIPQDRWILEVAEGLSYLHEVGIIHGALRGTNVLIGQDYNVMLSDFDVRLFYLSTAYKSAIGNSSLFPDITLRWEAPELWGADVHRPDDTVPVERLDSLEVCRRLLTYASDVFSFGCVCVEIYSGELPQYKYKGMPRNSLGDDTLISRLIMRGVRPMRPQALVSDDFWALIQRCWSQNPSDRPTIQQVIHQLPRTTAPIGLS